MFTEEQIFNVGQIQMHKKNNNLMSSKVVYRQNSDHLYVPENNLIELTVN